MWNNIKISVILGIFSLYLAVGSCHWQDVSKHPNLSLLPNDICGTSTSTGDVDDKATLLELPWMAVIHGDNGKGEVCGGTVINERYVLTAAKCIEPDTEYNVKLGTRRVDGDVDCVDLFQYLKWKKLCAPKPQKIAVEQTIIHANFSASNNDIALLRLSRKADLSTGGVRPICLPIAVSQQKANMTGRTAEIAGWARKKKASTDGLSLPSSAEQALRGPEGHLWEKAMQDELDSFAENSVWTLEKLPQGSKVVGNKWVFKKKVGIDGTTHYRAMLVAKGYSQSYGIDYFETYAPVVRRATLRILFAMAVNLDLKIGHLDVKTAFLNGDLHETVYMSQPEGFVKGGHEDKVCKLLKSVYGLKQSARSWNLKADKVLLELGFRNTPDEPCVYIKNVSSLIIVALYVDDFYIFYEHEKNKINLVKELQSRFNVKDLGEAKDCLGIQIERDWSSGTIKLCQEKYILSILTEFNMENCKGVATPMEFKLKLKDLGQGKDVNVPYQKLIGCLLYLSTNTRPDIAYVVSKLSQFNSCYKDVHWALSKRVLSYLKATSKLGLIFTKTNDECLKLEGYADADWAGDEVDYFSHTGFAFKLNNNLISWESRKQKLIALSSTESEYLSLSEAAREAVYVKNLLCEMFNCFKVNVHMYNDNQSAIQLAYSEGFSARTKHFGVRKQFLRTCVQKGDFSLSYVPTDQMPADVLTKSLGGIKHNSCCDFLGMSPD